MPFICHSGSLEKTLLACSFNEQFQKCIQKCRFQLHHLPWGDKTIFLIKRLRRGRKEHWVSDTHLALCPPTLGPFPQQKNVGGESPPPLQPHVLLPQESSTCLLRGDLLDPLEDRENRGCKCGPLPTSVYFLVPQWCSSAYTQLPRVSIGEKCKWKLQWDYHLTPVRMAIT